MTDVLFHTTRMGARFYEHTVPEIARQLARLNDHLERLIEYYNAEEKIDGESHQDETDPTNR